ncbi:hypothetical protein [Burkholderia pyrrocinia]|uniref:hypothetical protein n=1 Tax=Burkholderia pyrrocinia TaxID=60550 RepID=UPI001BCDDBDF|nr:hypothetical protein [Burkholderia pyrrocinia]QVN23392.1 hypothetical protein JYG32_33440 [Burkholderia pyrrocinia]
MKQLAKYLVAAGLAASLSTVALAAGIDVNIGAPALVTPAPVVVTSATGWHGDRYWDGHRYWERTEWERHEHRGDGRHHGERGHCPPGLAKKGAC